MTRAPGAPETAEGGDAASVLQGARIERLAAKASAQDVLTAVGETIYEWDIASDRIRWGGNAAQVLGISDVRILATSASYDSLLHPDSFTNRHQAVLNGIGVDYGAGVPFDVTYALRLSTESGMRTVWVHDCGIWFAGADGAPYLARGVVRLCRTASGRSSVPAPARELPRRGAFLRILNGVLAMAAHYKTGHAFVALAIDNLPVVTRCFGVPAVEELEAAIGERIRAAVRSGDVVGWLSDCELGLILTVGDSAEADQAVERIVRAISDTLIPTSAGAVGPIVAAGVVIAPFQASSLEQCLSRAHEAQALARRKGAGQYVFYEPSSWNQETHGEAEIARSVQRALTDEAAELTFRPVVGSANGAEAFVGCALSFGMDNGEALAFSEAAPVIRALGLSGAIDCLTLAMAAAELKGSPARTLAVPISADTLRDPSWVADLASVLAAVGAGPERLILQVSEAEVAFRGSELGKSIAAIRDLGCPLLLADFGSSFVSARILHEVQPRFVQLDRALTRSHRDRRESQEAIQRLIEGAKTFGAGVIAETRDHAENLAGLSLDYLELPDAVAPAPVRHKAQAEPKTRQRARKVA